MSLPLRKDQQEYLQRLLERRMETVRHHIERVRPKKNQDPIKFAGVLNKKVEHLKFVQELRNCIQEMATTELRRRRPSEKER